MKLLVDENLSPKLGKHLSDIFETTQHVRDLGLKSKSDTQIWSFARDHGYDVIITADQDFQKRVLQLGPPLKLFESTNVITQPRTSQTFFEEKRSVSPSSFAPVGDC
jgi:predicted nuclease of predicted toxin-antitoxin system